MNLLLTLQWSAFVGVVACLISESNIATPIRETIKQPLLYCPICLGFWLAIPAWWFGAPYFLTVAMSNVWMLIILKTYEALES